MRNATLRQLKVFECVARHLSFTRAARELHLTQPAVSTQVKQLEEHTGLPLFELVGKKVHLTHAGHAMLDHSRAIIAQFRDADEAMQHLKGISGGRLVVTVISAGDYFFPRVLAAFARVHPRVAITLGVSNRAELLRRMADNTTDLGIMGRPPNDRDVIAEPFAPHPYVVVAAPDHPLARKTRLSIADLAHERFIVREEGSDTRATMAEVFRGVMSRLPEPMEIASNETVKQTVIAGMGIAFLSAHTVALELEVGRLAMLDVQGFPALRNWYVVHRRQKRLPPVADAFRAFVVEEGASLIEEATHLSLQSPRRGARARRRRDHGSS